MFTQSGFRERPSAKEGTYEKLRTQLEQQNAMLLQQRQQLQSRSKTNLIHPMTTLNPMTQQQSGFTSYSSPKNADGKNENKIETICEKIEEIIDLCNQNENLQQIAKAEKRILSYLSTPQKTQKGNEKAEMSSKKSIKSKQSQQKRRSHKKSIRDEITNKGYYLSDEIMEIIESIERKALVQIESLRLDKINLLRRLNQEIKDNNDLKRNTFGRQNAAINLRSSSVRANQRVSHNLENIEEVDEQYLNSSAREKQTKRSANRNTQRVGNSHRSTNNERSPTFNRKTQENNLSDGFRNTKPRGPGQLIQSLQFNEQFHPTYVNPKNHQKQIEKEIAVLRQQNEQIKNVISKQQTQNQSPFKYNLRNQLKQLRGQALRYQNLLATAKKHNQNYGPLQNADQLQTLFLQSSNLMSQGRRLMKVRSNPSLRVSNAQPRWNSIQHELNPSSNPFLMTEVD